MTTLKWTFVTALAVYIAATLRMTHHMKDFGGTETVPDLKFGFTADSLRELREHTWGEKGCEAYVKAASVDLLAYMEAYTAALWCLATIVSRNTSTQRKTLARLSATIPMCFDVIETLILRQTCLSDVSDKWVLVGSMANQMKWLTIGSFLAVFLPLWYCTRWRSDNNVKAE
mmetsp:Transcript_25504/g.48309  ORF Transcript_25504/g.48309 Transcript_25504/m.48309 type:complete len:172 (+) Transcript_25504:38-553(+)